MTLKPYKGRCQLSLNSKTYVKLFNINQLLIQRHNLIEFDYALNVRKVNNRYSDMYTPYVLKLLKDSIRIRNKVAHFEPINESEFKLISTLLTFITATQYEDTPPEYNQCPHSRFPL